MPFRIRTIVEKIWPRFFFHKPNVHLDSFYTFSDYPKIWYISICLLTVTSLAPLILATLIHYKLIQRSVDSELVLRAERLASNAKRSVVFFIDERLDALTFTINEVGYDNLSRKRQLKEVLNNLKLGFGGITDLSVIDSSGHQVAYAGPYDLEGKSYKDQPWFIRAIGTEFFVSEVFTGYRDAPHMIIAVRSKKNDGSAFLLRATLDTERLMQVLTSHKPSVHTDIFLMNHRGELQTPSARFGQILTRVPLAVPDYSPKTKVSKIPTGSGSGEETITNGYSYIVTDKAQTPFILMVLKEKEGVMRSWLDLGRNFNWIIGISSVIIVVIIALLSSFLVNRLYLADRTKAQTMLQMEQSQQLASIGQLAAGVAHEINNPLALINETAGYMKDVYSFAQASIDQDEIMEHIDSILEATERCGTITRQLLGFVRQFDIKIREIELDRMIDNVLTFHKKEAEYRDIIITTSYPDKPILMKTDSGKLQQILVNLVTNAFHALDDSGCLNISADVIESHQVQIVIKDTGCGIPEHNIEKIQEPFFSTKQEDGGSGLGLSITYGLVKKLKGSIHVESTEGVGTVFTISLPVNIQEGELV